jgi:hypothetical protein
MKVVSLVSLLLLPVTAAFAPLMRPAFTPATKCYSSVADDEVMAALKAMKPSKPAKSKEEDIELTIKAIKAFNPKDFEGDESEDEKDEE